MLHHRFPVHQCSCFDGLTQGRVARLEELSICKLNLNLQQFELYDLASQRFEYYNESQMTFNLMIYE